MIHTIFPSKTPATQTGLGWIGKTALLVTPFYGSAVHLGTVFTDLILPTGKPVTTSRCGNCRECVVACPVNAGEDVLWQAGMPRERIFDAAACDRYLQRYREFDPT